MPTSATGRPTGVRVNIPRVGIVGSSFCAATSWACTTRLVLVPMSVQTPPRIAA